MGVERGEPVVCFDTDRENASLRDIPALKAEPVSLFLPNSDEIDVNAMDAMTERMRNAPLPDHAPTAELTYNFPLTPLWYDLAYFGADDPASAVEHWASQWQDTGFTHLMCWRKSLTCPWKLGHLC